LFEKRDVESLQRVASARTMDGFKIRAKLALNFPKAVNNAEAEEIMMQYARAFASAVECELSNGELPFEEQELYQRITDQVTTLPKKNVRLIGLHIWQKGAVSSRSMLAVKPEGNPTVPAMPAVSQTREKAVSPAGAHTATTIKPDARSITPPTSSAAPAPPSMSNQVAVSPQPTVKPAPPVATTARAPAASPPPSSRVTTPAAPAVRPAPTPGLPNARPAGSTSGGVSSTRYSSGSARTAAPAPASTTRPAAPAAAPSATSMAASRMVSGVVPAVDTRIVRSKSGFSTALEQSPGDGAEAVGRALAQPVRDAAADVLFATLGALQGTISDPLSLLDGRADEELRRGLVGEACVYVCYVLYEALTRTSLPQMQSILVVQGACVQALLDQTMPVSELSRYLATESPREEFSGRVCALFGVRETPEMQQRVDAHLRALRLDVRSCTEQIEQRLSRGKGITEKTG
jgi:outer membrane biosynthesis protein TonB